MTISGNYTHLLLRGIFLKMKSFRNMSNAYLLMSKYLYHGKTKALTHRKPQLDAT